MKKLTPKRLVLGIVVFAACAMSAALAIALTSGDPGPAVASASKGWFSGDMIGRKPSAGAVEFPLGDSYEEALKRLYIAATSGGTPEGGRLVSPLPSGVVLADLRAEGTGIQVDLTAPWGYDPESGLALSPVVALSAEGRRLAPIQLPACQILAVIDVAAGQQPACAATETVRAADGPGLLVP